MIKKPYHTRRILLKMVIKADKTIAIHKKTARITSKKSQI